MKPMFSYFGSKYKLAKRYGAPRHDTVIEPFAGSAAYSLFWEPKRVILIDKNPVVTSIWKYLIDAREEEILALPDDFLHVKDLDISDGAKALIGFWIGKGKASPGLTRSKWAREYRDAPDCKVWNASVRQRIASQMHKIRQWGVIDGDSTVAPDIQAHWFIDPPYSVKGQRYPVKDVNYPDLAIWANSRRGFIQVCENEGATWLPFNKFHSVNTYHHMRDNGIRLAKYTQEVLYEHN
jgi:D12 class N6 adenine-specific DNA methyltransferase